MSTNNLFSNNESDSNNQTELSSEASLELLVGEGKKYANAGELAKAMVHSQTHITKLEGEATTLREGAQKQTSIDEILAAIKSDGNNQQQQSDDNQNLADQQSNDTNQAPDIAQQIQTAMAERELKTTAQANVATVTASLGKALGDRANEVYTAVGKSLGVDLDELAKTSPDAVIKLCTGQQQVVTQQGETLQTQHSGGQQVIITDSSQMNLAQLKVHAAEVKMPREERFKLEMENALKQGDSFFDKTNQELICQAITHKTPKR